MSKVIEILDSRDEFVTDVDGFVYWWPHGSVNGHLAAHHLREIADELDRRNAEWGKQIDEYFNKHQ